MNNVKINPDGIYLNGEKFFLLSGDFHYFRTLPHSWERRLHLMKDFGITAVTTYVPWNLHEPKRGEYDFSGICNLEGFLTLCQRVGLKVVLRLSPYLCGEWEFGGLPSWLLRDRRICLRSADPLFIEPLREYYEVLLKKVKPHLYTNGGPVILVGAENEYGSFGNDKEYLRELMSLFEANGIDVPCVSANGSDPFKYLNGTLPQNWNGADLGAYEECLTEMERMAQYQPDKPLMVGEAWVGSIMFWGRDFERDRDIEKNCAFFKKALEMGVTVNFYMFCGGTNFGFMSGALSSVIKDKYVPLLTSYDYDAPISESGVPTEKYYALRDVLDDFLGRPRRPQCLELPESQAIPEVKLTKSAPLFENLENIASSKTFTHRTHCMEDLGQDYGFVVYKTHIEYTDPRKRILRLDGVRDLALVYIDGKYYGSILRDCKASDICFTVPESGCELTLLVENMGRVNYGYGMYDNKGVLGAVYFEIINPDGSKLYNFAAQMGFETYSLPLTSADIKKLSYTECTPLKAPVFYKGEFAASSGVDTFIDMKGFTKGVVFVNGFNLGRYWSVGPQRTLYCPGEILAERNTIEVFELYQPSDSLTLSTSAVALLCEPTGESALSDFELK